ncbi:hypothetical protein SUGI_0830840 [Cryptomeria japonica]|nr:hypothetical protein SUGI_0830840 [Cryptomeria japonica]
MRDKKGEVANFSNQQMMQNEPGDFDEQPEAVHEEEQQAFEFLCCSTLYLSCVHMTEMGNCSQMVVVRTWVPKTVGNLPNERLEIMLLVESEESTNYKHGSGGVHSSSLPMTSPDASSNMLG